MLEARYVDLPSTDVEVKVVLARLALVFRRREGLVWANA